MTAKKNTTNTKKENKSTAKKATVKATASATVESIVTETKIEDVIDGINAYEVAPDVYDLTEAPKGIVEAVMESIPQEEETKVSITEAEEALKSIPQDVKDKHADAKTVGVKQDNTTYKSDFYKRNIGFMWNGVEMDW